MCKDHRCPSLTITIWNLCLFVNNWTAIIWRGKNPLNSSWQYEQEHSVCLTAAVGYTGWCSAIPNRCSTVGIVRWERPASSECGVHMGWCHPACAWCPWKLQCPFTCCDREGFIVVGTPSLLTLHSWPEVAFPSDSGLCFQDTSHGRLLCSSILKPPTLVGVFWQKWEVWRPQNIFSVAAWGTLQGRGFSVVVCSYKIFLNSFQSFFRVVAPWN